MSIYSGIGAQAKQVSKLYVGIGNTARQIQKAYVGVDGQARLVYQSGSPISGRSIGSVVRIKLDGAFTNFIVVHHGLPNGDYDASCNGTWLLMQNLYADTTFGATLYENSNLHSYLCNTIFPQIDPAVQSIAMWAKIPFRDNVGAKGLDTRIFVPGAKEVGFNSSDFSNVNGAKLAYFGDNSSRIAYYRGGGVGKWWTRDRKTSIWSGTTIYRVETGGGIGNENTGGSIGVRPCIIVPFNTLVDDDGYIVA